MTLRDYEQHKFALAEILRSAARAVPAERSAWHDKARELLARLAEDRFNLAVIGRFNRGKTSLMNAMLGTDRLPTGIVPLTSVITSVAYGTREKAVLSFETGRLSDEIALADLPRYITQDGNPGNVRRIKTAEVKLPVDLLRRGFYFVDTPGLGSAIAENTRTTQAFVPEADAFLLVTSYESPLSEDEMRFLAAAASWPRRIFIVINKQDMVDPGERREALDYVRAQIADRFDAEAPAVFSTSARDGLIASRAGDEAGLEASGLTALQDALVAFLLEDKSTDFLRGMCRRIADLVRCEPAFALEAEPRLAALAQQIGEISAAAPARSGPRSRAGHDIGAELRPCEICAGIDQKLWQFLRDFQYDIGGDANAQRRFADHGGFCNFHMWQYERIASPLGTCTGFPALLDRRAAELRDLAGADPSSLAASLAAHEAGRTDCAMCAVRGKAEVDAIGALANRLSAGTSALAELSAVCLPHLAMLISGIPDPGLARALIERQIAMLERVSEDMQRYALKRDAVRRQLLTEEETEAARRALLLLVGRRTLGNAAPQAASPAGAGDRRRPERAAGSDGERSELLASHPHELATS
jgi:GTP-binding protein EngB required for normal cell division